MSVPKITFEHEQLYFTKEGLPLFVPKRYLKKITRKGKVTKSMKTVDLVEAAKLSGITLNNLTVEALIKALNEMEV